MYIYIWAGSWCCCPSRPPSTHSRCYVYNVSIYISIHLSISIYLSVHPYIYISVDISICLPISISIYLSIYLYGRDPDAAAPVARLPHTQGVMYIMYPSIHPPICSYLSIYLSIYLSVDLSICLSISISIYLSIRAESWCSSRSRPPSTCSRHELYSYE